MEVAVNTSMPSVLAEQRSKGEEQVPFTRRALEICHELWIAMLEAIADKFKYALYCSSSTEPGAVVVV